MLAVMTVSTRLWTTEATGGMGRGGVGRAGGAVIDRIISATAIIPTSRHPECRRKRFVQCERNNTKRTYPHITHRLLMRTLLMLEAQCMPMQSVLTD